jgi:Heparinase II/III-like protein/Heparinase II/III N-terminus
VTARAGAWQRRIARLRSMAPREILDRIRQQWSCRLDAWRSRRGHDFAGGVGSQPPESLGHFFFAPSDVPALCAALQQRLPAAARGILAQAEKILEHRFDLLGYENLDYGPEINWHLDMVHGKQAPHKPWFKVSYLNFEEVGDSKITWELNRHQHLVTLAKAYRLTTDERFARELMAQWKHWQAANPYPMGINWASSLEVAIRSVSWIWVYFLLADCDLMTSDLRRDWMRALAISGRHMETFLSTYFSPNTHLLGEAVALFFLGTLFPEFPRAALWKNRGWQIVLDAAAKQVRDDGFYFEQSTYYHVYALDMFLHARILAALNGIAIPPAFDQTLTKMLEALCLLGRAGIAPMMGDDDGGRWFDSRRNQPVHLLDPLSTGAILFRRGDFKYLAGGTREESLWLLGERGLSEFDALKSTEPSSDSVALRASGFYLMADAEAGQQLIIDAGPHGPGHGHADALSLQLLGNGRPLLMDPGTYEYVGDSGERERYRGTGAHNTMRVDGVDQAEAIDPFGWAKPPAIRVEYWIVGRYFDLFAGSHDGYGRLPEPVTHQRRVFHRKGQFWLVLDRAEGSGKHQLELLWHLSAGLSPVSTKDNLFAVGQDGIRLTTANARGWAQSAHRENCSAVYGHQERATVLTFSSSAELPAEFATLLSPDVTLQRGSARLERIASDASASAYCYRCKDEEHQFFFAHRAGPWIVGNWGSDARFLYWAIDRERDRRTLVLCGGTYAETGGVRVFASERLLDYAEVVTSGSGTEVFSSDLDALAMPVSLDRIEMQLAMPRNDQGTGT